MSLPLPLKEALDQLKDCLDDFNPRYTSKVPAAICAVLVAADSPVHPEEIATPDGRKWAFVYTGSILGTCIQGPKHGDLIRNANGQTEICMGDDDIVNTSWREGQIFAGSALYRPISVEPKVFEWEAKGHPDNIPTELQEALAQGKKFKAVYTEILE